MSDATKNFMARVAIVMLAAVVLSVTCVLLAGLFHPEVDNDKILALLGPAFNMIIGCMIGIVAMSKKEG